MNQLILFSMVFVALMVLPSLALVDKSLPAPFGWTDQDRDMSQYSMNWYRKGEIEQILSQWLKQPATIEILYRVLGKPDKVSNLICW